MPQTGYAKSRLQHRTTVQTIGPHCVRSTGRGVCTIAHLHSPTTTSKIKFSWLYTRRNGFHTLQWQCTDYRCQNSNVNEDYDLPPFKTREQCSQNYKTAKAIGLLRLIGLRTVPSLHNLNSTTHPTAVDHTQCSPIACVVLQSAFSIIASNGSV